MANRLWKHPGLHQGVEPGLRQAEHFRHFHDGNNCFSFFVLGYHRTTSARFQDGFGTTIDAMQDGNWAVSALKQEDGP